MLQYAYMQNALIISVMLAIMVPLIGVVLVLKRLSTMGEALSHTSLAGVAIGLVAGINPVLTAVVVSVLASLAIELIRKSYAKYTEISTNIVLSAGIGLAAVLSGYVGNPVDFNSFLFGSLITVGTDEVVMVVALSVLVILASLFLYKELLAITLDEENARLSGIPVGAINLVFTVMMAVTVSVSARAVGALMISSLIVLPVACAMQVARSYRQTMLFSVGFALVFTVAGLFLSYVLNWRPGGTVVLTGVAVLLILLPTRRLFRRAA